MSFFSFFLSSLPSEFPVTPNNGGSGVWSPVVRGVVYCVLGVVLRSILMDTPLPFIVDERFLFLFSLLFSLFSISFISLLSYGNKQKQGPPNGHYLFRCCLLFLFVFRMETFSNYSLRPLFWLRLSPLPSLDHILTFLKQSIKEREYSMLSIHQEQLFQEAYLWVRFLFLFSVVGVSFSSLLKISSLDDSGLVNASYGDVFIDLLLVFLHSVNDFDNIPRNITARKAGKSISQGCWNLCFAAVFLSSLERIVGDLFEEVSLLSLFFFFFSPLAQTLFGSI